jgi:hypothetical protein
MKHYLLNGLFILMFTGLLISCSKEAEVLTSGQIISRELQQIIKENKVVRIERRTVDYPAQTQFNGTTNFEFQDELIRLDETWYNLNYIVYSDIHPFTEESFDTQYKLVLFFEY